MSDVPEITVAELPALLAQPAAPRLIDVREPDEWAVAKIPGAELLPLSQWPALALETLTDKNQPLLMQCHHGSRSARATAWLLSQGYTDVRNVAGGIDAYSVEIDPKVARY
jgi:rhodanese-related sulfurtransferase